MIVDYSIDIYWSKTVVWMEKEKSRNRVVQMDNIIGLFSIRKIDRISNSWVIELCKCRKKWMKMKKSLDKMKE